MQTPAARFLRAAFAGILVLCRAAFGTEPVVVASYNVDNWLLMERYSDGKRVSTTQPKPEAEKAAVVRVITEVQPDILGLAELGQRSDLADLQSRLEAAGLNYPHSEWVDGPDTSRHIALLSKFPIVERASQTNIAFDLDGTLQYFQRGILDVTVEPRRGYRLRLLGLHLKSRRDMAAYDQDALRAKEAWFLRKHVEGIVKDNPNANVLLYGDFNDTKNAYPIREIIGQPGSGTHLPDILVTDAVGDRWTHFWKTADEYSRIDFFFASRGLLPEIVHARSGINRSPVWFKASDHRLIYTTIWPENR